MTVGVNMQYDFTNVGNKTVCWKEITKKQSTHNRIGETKEKILKKTTNGDQEYNPNFHVLSAILNYCQVFIKNNKKHLRNIKD